MLHLLARPRRDIRRWTACLAATALVGTALVADIGNAPPATALTEIALPSTILATAEDLPDGTITRVELTGSLIALQVSADGLPSQVWTLDRDDVDPAWRQISGMESLHDAQGDLVHGALAGIGAVVMRMSDGAYRAIPQGYQVSHDGKHGSFSGSVNYDNDASVTIQDAISGSPIAVTRLSYPSRAQAGYRASDSFLALMGRTTDVTHVEISTGRTAGFEETKCDGSYNYPEGNVAGFDGRFTFVRCHGSLYSVHDREVYRPARIDLVKGATLSESWSLNNGVMIGVSDGIYHRPTVLNPWTGAIGRVFDAPTSLSTFAAHGDTGVFASGDALHTVDLSPITSSILSIPPDSSAPSVTIGGRTWSATRTYTVAFDASDPDVPGDQYKSSRVSRIEGRYRTKLRGAASFGAWSAPIVVGSSRTATAPTGSSTCWQARAIDRAGNVGAWSAEHCVQIDGAAPSVSARALPSSTKATGTTTDVTFRWYGNDTGGIDRWALRYRATPRGQRAGEWTYRDMGTASSFTKGWGRSRTVCFQVNARDKAGNQSAWSDVRCTYVDGIKPKVTRASVARWMSRWPSERSGVVLWEPTFRYAASDDKGVHLYQRQNRISYYSGGLDSPSTSGWLTSTSDRFRLEPVAQECARVRAKDRAGNVSAWSPWRCSNAAADYFFGLDDTDAISTYARDVGLPVDLQDSILVVGSGYGTQFRTDDSYRVHAVRLHMVVGPSMGRAHVYVGGTRVGTVDTRRSTWGIRAFTVRSSEQLSGKVRVVAATGKTATSHLYVIR